MLRCTEASQQTVETGHERQIGDGHATSACHPTSDMLLHRTERRNGSFNLVAVQNFLMF
jgi:hypothetical protein